MTTLAEYEQKAVWKMCLFGRAKVGKTALALALAQVWKLHWFDLEDGIKTGLNSGLLPRQYWGNINVFPIPGKQAAPMGIETLLKVVNGGEKRICWNHGKVQCPACEKQEGAIINTIDINKLGKDDCLVIDSTTELSSQAKSASVAFILKDAIEPHQFVMDKDSGGKNFKYPEAVNYMLEKIFSTLQTARFNVIVISHEVMTERLKDTGHVVKQGENQPNDGVETIFPAAGSRNFSRNFGRYFDLLVHVDIVNRRHVAHSSTTYSSNVQTGSRLGRNIEDYVGADKKPIPPQEAIVKLFTELKGDKNVSVHKPS